MIDSSLTLSAGILVRPGPRVILQDPALVLGSLVMHTSISDMKMQEERQAAKRDQIVRIMARVHTPELGWL